jgi:ankyrin repeat protein
MTYHLKFVVYLVIALAVSAVRAGAYEDFFRAVNVDNVRTVNQLLERGFDPNAADEKGQVGLYLALREGSLQVAEALLKHPGLKVDAVNAADETPVMMAALRGNLEWTQRLLDHGAQLNRKGWTPLHYAASGPEPKVVSLLLDRGAEIEARSPNGTTPLMMAARYGAYDAAERLLARGADPRARNDLGLSAADFARQGGRDALAATLEKAAK